jgi:HSP20 family protein
MTLLTRWEPFRESSTMQDRMNRVNRLFRESYSPEGPEEALTTTSYAPPADIYEDEHNITLKLEVPGIDEKDIDVRIENTTLTVHGERKIEKEEKEENFRRVERQYGEFTRSFTLPSAVDPGQVTAHYDKGVLKINLAKKAEAEHQCCPTDARVCWTRLVPHSEISGPQRLPEEPSVQEEVTYFVLRQGHRKVAVLLAS